MSPFGAAAATAPSSNPKPTRNSNATIDGFNFLDGSNEIQDFSFRFSKTGPEKGNQGARKPRLMKVRKKTSEYSNFRAAQLNQNPFVHVFDLKSLKDSKFKVAQFNENPFMSGFNGKPYKESNIKVAHSNENPFGFGFQGKTLKESNFEASQYNKNPFELGVDGKSLKESNFKINSFGSNDKGFVFGASSSSSFSYMSNANVEHMKFVFKDDKSRENLGSFEFSSRKSSGTWNSKSENNDMPNSNLKNDAFGDREEGMFVFGGSKSLNRGMGFVFGKDGIMGNLNIDKGGFGLGAKTDNGDENMKSRHASIFSTTAFEFGVDTNSVPKELAKNVVECGANECETHGACGKSEGNVKKEPGVEVNFVACNDPCSDAKTSWVDNTVVGRTNKLGEKINLSNTGKGDGEESSGNKLEESLLSNLTDEMKKFTVHAGETTVRENKVEDSTNNFFMKFDAKFVLGYNENRNGVSIEKDNVNNRSVRGKMSKKSKTKLRRGLVAEQLAGKDNVNKRDSFQKNGDSPECCSPMDFSPYRPTDSAASGSKGNADGRGYDSLANDEGSRGYQSTNSDNGCLDHSNAEMGGEFSTSTSGQDGLSSIRHQYKKKYKLKVGNGLKDSNQSQKAASNSVSEQSSTTPCNSSRTKKTPQSKSKSKNTGYIFQERAKHMTADVTSEQACDEWRIRGNQAFKDGNLSTAEEYYTKGIDSVPDKSFMQPLLLCYSNRAATRMSLGRIREALSDCKMAASLDISFLKVKLRAANCHLVLGEVKDAEMYYNDCLESERHVCLDRRITVEAADGLQKAQKVAEYMQRSAELLQQCSSDSANNALEVISEALRISCYSDKLFEMKGQALCMLLMYEEVIQLCEKTLHIAERNFMACHYPNVNDYNGHGVFPRLWRWRLMAKSHYHLGKLELALDLIEKQEQLTVTSNDKTPELSNALAASIRQLLALKKSGNEAFQCGRHGEAVEHYTAAISKSVESRSFAAICFCNRAAAYQAMGQLIDAIADCSLAIALDENYSKAVSRRATLHELIRDYEHAANDIRRLIYLLENPPQKGSHQSNKSGGSSTKELQQARCRLSSVEKKLKKASSLDLYLILGVKVSDAESEIKKAYRKAALRHHPDKAAQLLPRNDVGDDGKLWKEIIDKVHKDADRLFKMIGESYSVLSDPEKRLNYNDEEELRDVLGSNNRSSRSGKTSDFYNSPSGRSGSSGRKSDYNGSPFGRSSNQRNWEEGSWRGYNSHYQW